MATNNFQQILNATIYHTRLSTQHHLSKRSTAWSWITPSTLANTLTADLDGVNTANIKFYILGSAAIVLIAIIVPLLLILKKYGKFRRNRQSNIRPVQTKCKANSWKDDTPLSTIIAHNRSPPLSTMIVHNISQGKNSIDVDMNCYENCIGQGKEEIYQNVYEFRSGSSHPNVSSNKYLSRGQALAQEVETPTIARGIVTSRLPLEDMSHEVTGDRPIGKLENSITLGSIDSGFQSLAPTSVCLKYWQSRSTVPELVKSFRTKDVEVGKCYNYEYVSMGMFDEAGGTLTLHCDDTVNLVIPRGALDCRTVVYINIEFQSELDESKDTDSYIECFSPEFNCGPDGLRFKVPVQLTIPSCASEGTHVTCQSQQDEEYEWLEEDGCTMVSRGDGTITMDITHFTRFRLASKIPIAKADAQNMKIGKKLVLLWFHCGNKVRVYYAENIVAVQRRIEDEEKNLSGIKLSPAKPFIFYKHQGGLMIDIKSSSSSKNHKFSDQQVLQLDYNFVEYELPPAHPATHIDIKVCLYQPKVGNQKAELVRQIELLPHARYPQNMESDATLRSVFIEPLKRARSVSDVLARTPSEGCGCPGACNCLQQRPIQSPVENDDPTTPRIVRKVETRRSKESGYASLVSPKSSTNDTTKIGPLVGPDEMLYGNLTDSETSNPYHSLSSITPVTLAFPNERSNDIDD